MTLDDIIKLAKEAKLPHKYDTGRVVHLKELERFAALVAAAEREKVARWMIEKGYATGHGDTIEDLLQELDWQIAEKQEPVTILPDGSAFGVMSFPLPDDHWLYAPNQCKDGEYEPIDLPKPILTLALRDAVVAAVRYAVRGATMRGQETDFDPDALVQTAVYALCGPDTTPQPQEFVLTQTNVGIGERGMQAYEEAKKRGWVGISDERLMGEQ